MNAFVRYTKEETNLRLMMEKLQHYGYFNCNFQTFNRIYIEWHLKSFPGCPVNTDTANFRQDWFADFLRFLSEYEIKQSEVNRNASRFNLSELLRRIFKRSS